MEIISLTKEYIKSFSKREDSGIRLFDLTKTSFLFIDRQVTDGINVNITFSKILVEEKHEMRMDLLFMDMYDIDVTLSDIYLGNIDVILAINNIDNPLNIRKGMIIKFPPIDQFSFFRINPDDDLFDKKNNKSVKDLLVVPNKSTRKDKSREKFKESGYSLPPVVLRTPKKPVSISNNGTVYTISSGGI